MALTIYGMAFSPYVARVLLAATIKGMAWRVEEPPGGNNSPRMLKISPFGKMPVMIDGTTRLFESTVIVEYLDAKRKSRPLVPKGAKAGAAVRLIGAIAAEYVQLPAIKLIRYWYPKSTDPRPIAKAKAELDHALNVLERYMARGRYAGGARLSIADVYVIPVLLIAVAVSAELGDPDLLGTRRKLARYWKGLQTDKTLKPALETMTASMQASFRRRD